MNFYNPYMSAMPYIAVPARTGIFSRLFRNFSFSSILSGTQRTLGFINQAIPAIRNVSPIVKNAKTMFKVMNEFRKSDSNNKNSNNSKFTKQNQKTKENYNESINNNQKNNAPVFFI